MGYPYVWGGSSPSTSFDCSGFISWVINHSGWNVGRQTAQGALQHLHPVSPEQAKPGDLVFFVGTYDTAGVSHVGLYVGNSVMLHCGDPISYTTSIRVTGSSIFIVTGVCLERQKGVYHYGNEQTWTALKRILRKPRPRSRSCKSSFGSWKRQDRTGENLQIVQLVRGLNMTPQEFAAFVRGGALQAAPAPIPDFEQEDSAHEEI